MENSKTAINKIELAEYQLSYLFREGGDQCILFIHGLGCSKESFSDAFDGHYFPDEYTLIAPDLLGHGDSSSPDNFSYKLEEQADLLSALLKSLGLFNPNIVAHSMGGVIALLLIDRLDQVSSYFSLEGNLIAEDCNISKKVSLIDEGKFVNNYFSIAPLNFRCRGYESDPPASPLAFHRSASSLVQWSFHGDLLRKFNDLTIKKSYIYGEENKKISLLNMLDDTDLIRIKGCGHFMMMDNPTDTYLEIYNQLKVPVL